VGTEETSHDARGVVGVPLQRKSLPTHPLPTPLRFLGHNMRGRHASIIQLSTSTCRFSSMIKIYLATLRQIFINTRQQADPEALRVPDPSLFVRAGQAPGGYCRCTGYRGILAHLLQVSSFRQDRCHRMA
jgi:hypothetical protein